MHTNDEITLHVRTSYALPPAPNCLTSGLSRWQVPGVVVPGELPTELDRVPRQITAPLEGPEQTAQQLPVDFASIKTIQIDSIPDRESVPVQALQQAPSEVPIQRPGEAATSGDAVPAGTGAESHGILHWQLPEGDFAHTGTAPLNTAAGLGPLLQEQLQHVRGSLAQELGQFRGFAPVGASLTPSSDILAVQQASTFGTAPAESEAGARSIWDWQLPTGDLSQAMTAAQSIPLPQEALRGSSAEGTAPMGASLTPLTEARPSLEASVSGPADPVGTGAGSRSIWDWQLPAGALSMSQTAVPSTPP